MKDDAIVLGAGWAGLLVGLRLNGENKNISFIDKDKELGGLLKSETIDGFTFDTGGPHLLFSRNSDILEKIKATLGRNITKKERNNFIFFNGEYIQYPFENGIYSLNPVDRMNIVQGIIERMIEHSCDKNWQPTNFKDWATGIFGDAMASQYLIPYNKKIWKRPLDRMAADWTFTPGRLPYPELGSLLEATAGIKNIGYKEQAIFYYPERGGIKSLYDAVYTGLKQTGSKFINNTNIDSIERISSGRYVVNSTFNTSSVINTIPLPEAILSVDKSSYTKSLSRKFDWNSVAVVGVAISQKTPNQTAVYVPDDKVIFHRYTWMSTLITPDHNNCSNLIAEVTIPKGEPYDRANITNRVIHDLVNIGVIEDENKVLFSRFWFHNYGYAIYTLDHNDVRKKAMEILDSVGIKSVGRWGSWHYWNTDMVYKAVDELKCG